MAGLSRPGVDRYLPWLLSFGALNWTLFYKLEG